MDDLKRPGHVWGLAMILLLSILGGCNSSSQSGPDSQAASSSQTGSSSATTPMLAISGTPAAAVGVGATYTFSPAATSAAGSPLMFSVQNQPAWTSFDASTGQLTGSPGAADVGTYSNILIAVTAGTSSASLPKFNISVIAEGAGNGTVVLSWMPPTTNSDGTVLTNLAGYHIVYGIAPDALTRQITITSAGLTNYVIANLSAGTWYFAVRAFNSTNVRSRLSALVHKTI